ELIQVRQGSGVPGAGLVEPVPKLLGRTAAARRGSAEVTVRVRRPDGLLAPEGQAGAKGRDQHDVVGRERVEVLLVAGDLHERGEFTAQCGRVVAVHQNPLASGFGLSRSRATSSMSRSSSTWSLSTPWAASSLTALTATACRMAR